jgi:hypothetical protein
MTTIKSFEQKGYVLSMDKFESGYIQVTYSEYGNVIDKSILKDYTTADDYFTTLLTHLTTNVIKE